MALLALVGAALMAQAAAPEGSPGTCQPHPLAQIAVAMRGPRKLRPMVGAEINGEPAQMMLDTGAVMTFVYQTSLERLHLNAVPMPSGMRMTSLGQPIDSRLSAARSLVFGPRTERDVPLAVEDDREYGAWSDGLIGQPEFGDADLELDFAHGTMRLFAPDDCAGATPAYWAGPGETVATVELERQGRQSRPFGRVTVNGVDLRAMFDTGSPTTGLTLAAAARAGVKPGGKHVVQTGDASGIGGKVKVRNWRGLFATLDVGGEALQNVTLDVTDKPASSAEILIGADWFATHRVFISRSRGKLYATPVGKGGLAAQPRSPPP